MIFFLISLVVVIALFAYEEFDLRAQLSSTESSRKAWQDEYNRLQDNLLTLYDERDKAKKNHQNTVDALHEEKHTAKAAWHLNVDLRKRNEYLNKCRNQTRQELATALREHLVTLRETQRLRAELLKIAQNAQKRDEHGRFIKTAE